MFAFGSPHLTVEPPNAQTQTDSLPKAGEVGRMAIIAAMDGGAESAAVGAACALAAVVGNNNEMVRSKALHLLNLTAWKRTEHVHAPF